MAEIPDRLPGEIIFASYSNDIRDRAVMRYVDRTARDNSVPVPVTGDLAYITTLGVFEIFDGVAWRVYADDEQLVVVDTRLDLLEDQAYSTFELSTKTLTTTFSELNSVIVPADGDYLIHAVGWFDIVANSSLSARVNIELKKAGVNIETWNIGVQDIGGSVTAEIQQHFVKPAKALLLGEAISWEAREAISLTTAAVQNYMIYLHRVPAGTLP